MTGPSNVVLTGGALALLISGLGCDSPPNDGVPLPSPGATGGTTSVPDAGAAGASGGDSGAPTVKIDPDAPGARPGPYAVGHVDYMLGDAAVYDRRVAVSVWYPVDAATITSTSLPARYPLDPYSTGYLISTSKEWEAVGYDAAYEQPPPSGEGPFPLLMMSPGSGAQSWPWLYIGTRLASHGFVVAGVGTPPSTSPTSPANWPTSEYASSRDLSFALTELLSRTDASGDLLHGIIDASKIAVGGHSAGGHVAYALAGGDDDVCDGLHAAHHVPDEIPLLPYHRAECLPIAADPRIRAIVALDGPSETLRYRELARIVVPSLILGQAVESISSDTDPSYAGRALAGPHAAIHRNDSYRVDVPSANHFSFANICDVVAVAQALGSHDWDWVSQGYCCQDSFNPANNFPIRQIVTTYMLAFLNTHLALKPDAQMLTAEYAKDKQPSVEFFASEVCDAPLPAADYYTYQPHPGQCAVARQDPPDYFLENTPVPGFEIQAQGYVVSGTWAGYAVPRGITSSVAGAETTTITPPDFSDVAAGANELCLQGSVGAASDHSGRALIEMNVNQETTLDAGASPAGSVAIGGSGITVQYRNPGATALEVQIQTHAGATWYAYLSGLDGTETIPWYSFWSGEFGQACWTDSSCTHPPIGTAISVVSLAVPGGVAAVPFDFCLQGIGQAP